MACQTQLLNWKVLEDFKTNSYTRDLPDIYALAWAYIYKYTKKLGIFS